MKAFLKACKDKGITKVAIGTKHHTIKSSTNHPYSPAGWVFAFVPVKTKNKVDVDLLHEVVKELGISFSHGKEDCHMITKAGIDRLDHGVYHLLKKKWVNVAS